MQSFLEPKRDGLAVWQKFYITENIFFQVGRLTPGHGLLSDRQSTVPTDFLSLERAAAWLDPGEARDSICGHHHGPDPSQVPSSTRLPDRLHSGDLCRDSNPVQTTPTAGQSRDPATEDPG